MYKARQTLVLTAFCLLIVLGLVATIYSPARGADVSANGPAFSSRR